MVEYRKEKEWEIKYEVTDFSSFEVGMSHGPKKIEVTMKLTFPEPVPYTEASDWGSQILRRKGSRW